MIKKLQSYSYEKKRMIALFTALLCIAVYMVLILVYMRFRSVSDTARENMDPNKLTASASFSQSSNPLYLVRDSFMNVFKDMIPQQKPKQNLEIKDELETGGLSIPSEETEKSQ